MPSAADGETDHYFKPRSDLGSERRTVTLALPDLTVDLISDRGVFSADKIDPGTRLLLLEAPDPGADLEHVVDLGCGYGPIAVALAHRATGAHVWAVDVNRRALALAEENLAAVPAASVCHADEVPADLAVDLIWSNLPIRIGKDALHRLVRSWLARLVPGGYAIFVVHRHLGADSLARWLESEGHRVTRLRSRQGYRLLRVDPT